MLGKRRDESYKDFVDGLTARVPNQYRNNVANVLNTNEARVSYEILRHDGVDNEVIEQVMVESMGDFERGRLAAPGRYATAIGRKLQKLGQYDDVISDMHKEGLIDDRDFDRIRKGVRIKLEKHVKGTTRGRGLERLLTENTLRKAAIVILFTFGVIAIFSSESPLSGAVIGVGTSSYLSILIGFAALVLALVLAEAPKLRK